MNQAKCTSPIASQPASATFPFRVADDASDLLKRLFRHFSGSITARLWDGSTRNVGVATHKESGPHFVLVFHSPKSICYLVLGRDPLRLTNACLSGDVDIEGDVDTALRALADIRLCQVSVRDRMRAWLCLLRLSVLTAVLPDQSEKPVLASRDRGTRMQ